MATALPPRLISMPTKSYWHTRNLFNSGSGVSQTLPFARETLRQHTSDVCIIGAGIAGCSLAHHLMRLDPDVSVTLIDGRHIAGGATGRNGGLLWPCLNASLDHVIKTKGKEKAVEILCFDDQSAEQTFDLFELNPAMKELAEYSPFLDGGFQLFEGVEEATADIADLALMQSLGFGRDLELWSKEKTNHHFNSSGFLGGIRHPQVGRVWAARLALGLALAAAASAGNRHPAGAGRLTMIEATEVVCVQELGGGCDEESLRDYGGQGTLIGRDSNYFGEGGEVAERAKRRESIILAGKGFSETLCNSGIAEATTAMFKRGATKKIAPGTHSSSSSLKEGVKKSSIRKDQRAGLQLSVKTARGDAVRCSTIVHCTNAYTALLLPELIGKVVPVRNQVAVTSPLAPGQSLARDAAIYAREGFVYCSPRSDGRLVLGGFRDVLPHREVGTFDDGRLDMTVSQSLRRYLPDRFPKIFDSSKGGQAPVFEMEWSGILGFTEDRFPLVGALPPVSDTQKQYFVSDSASHVRTRSVSQDQSHASTLRNQGLSRRGQYICGGFSGHGMTRAYSCAEGLARDLMGLPPGPAPLPSAFSPEGRL
ncbi:hypothetical protein CEUSTIGMA_g12279.t1 [Chlamydomonas eustigma]|uniref:FAD dependent oxidoreductase domain-containing protein n=1 Tax=Chlamydomonas eustigma TaxID=1157962 RepID=A0A250XP75_9CHLO|nr:hypothetical protein CEUSTIGMA_g12279.t1 [Chlamydomonas eustigma]|eukprot:GAX84858.1 hypothetical protein CEUSTIGMA_g12279.t1 [Chlamydomonas eustigma]